MDHPAMEAERQNLLQSTISDLARRLTELRGYL
jgi:hypothetical protein